MRGYCICNRVRLSTFLVQVNCDSNSFFENVDVADLVACKITMCLNRAYGSHSSIFARDLCNGAAVVSPATETCENHGNPKVERRCAFVSPLIRINFPIL